MTLVGYWPLNGNSGSKAYDHSGNENHGTINDGGDSTIPGAKGILGENAYSFDGSNDAVETPKSFVYDFTGNDSMSLSAWFKSSDGSAIQMILGGRYSGNSSRVERTIELQNGKIIARVYKNSIEGPTYNLDEWYHGVFTYDAERTEYQLYVNGKKYGTNSHTPDRVDRYDIGGLVKGKDKSYLNGKVSEARIYNRPLTASEIQYLYNVGKRGLHTSSKKSS